MYGGHDGQRGPPRAGIGAQGAAQNPIIANINTGGSADGSGEATPTEKFSLFLSGIPASLDDRWLHDVLETVGSVLKVNRIRDASGKPKGFAFVEYGDAESVLRCLEIVNGVSLVGRDGEKKTLNVKADAKVRERLDTHEATRMKSSQLDDQTAFAKDALQEILTNIKAGISDQNDGGDEELNPDGTKKYKIPAHLQDLGPDDLPEESRDLVTREIAFFRERAAKREEANRLAEQKRDRARRENEDQRRAPDVRRQPPPSDSRSPRFDQGPSRFGAPSGSRGGSQQSPPPQRDYSHQRRESDSRMNGFVPSSSNASSSASYGASSQRNGMSDEDAERARLQRQKDQADQQFRTRLAAWEKRERGRQVTLDREKLDKAHEANGDDRRRTERLEKCASFDDDEEMERGNELFLIDRARWRKYRRQAKQREEDQDARDARLEAEQAEALKRESEDFLSKQAELFASMKGISVGVDASNNEPKKLKLAAPAPAEESKPKPKPSAVFAADEEEEGAKKKRQLIPLTYSDDEDDEETKAEKKKRKVKDLVSAIPNDKAGLWSYEVRWDKLSEAMIKDKLRPFVAKKSVEYLGSEEEEVIDSVIENLRAHKGPAHLADELEPVLAEEAEEMVIKIYRMLNFELLSAVHGIKL